MFLSQLTENQFEGIILNNQVIRNLSVPIFEVSRFAVLSC